MLRHGLRQYDVTSQIEHTVQIRKINPAASEAENSKPYYNIITVHNNYML